MILISKTYETVTQESLEYGVAEESGFEYTNMPFSFRELVGELEKYPHPSCSHGVPRWVSSYPEINYTTGEETTYSLHPGRDKRSVRYWEKACRAAGLILRE